MLYSNLLTKRIFTNLDFNEEYKLKGIKDELLVQLPHMSFEYDLCTRNFGKKDKNPLDFIRLVDSILEL